MPVVLHIGLQSAGSATLQRFLYENRQMLRMRGIGFTQSCGPQNNRDLATYAMDIARYDDEHLSQLGIRDTAARLRFNEDVEARFGSEVAMLRESCRWLILTSEHFQSRLRSVAEIRTLADLLARNGLQVARVVVYLRRPAEIIDSLYSTALRGGSSQPPPVAADEEPWSHICDHRATLERWAQVFGERVLVPRLFEPDALVGGSIIRDFSSSLRIDLRGLRVPPGESSSLTGTGQAVLRYLNRHFPPAEGGAPGARRAELVRFVERHFSAPAPAPSAALVAACEERFGPSNEWVRARYFNSRPALFTGDATPSPPAAPEEAPSTQMLLDAIATRWDGTWSLLDELRRRDPAPFEALVIEGVHPSGVLQATQAPRPVTPPTFGRRSWMRAVLERLADQALGSGVMPQAAPTQAQRHDSSR